MLNITHLNFLVGGNPLFQDASLQVFADQRIGLVGKNGCGKSTLFQLIRGELKSESGDVSLQAGKSLAFVEQEIANSTRPALEFVLDGDTELRGLEQALAIEVHDAAWFEAQHNFEAIDGYAAPARAAQLLNGLGFTNDDLQRPVASFSGGWRMRLNLARALMRRADLLLLDEPTNHLDLEAILWLEQYLARYPGSILMVSHDREFLNACVNRIAFVSNKAIETYSGNYDDFERSRAERAAQQNTALRQQQAKIAHLEDFVRRFRAKATKAKQAQSRLKALERLERIAPAHLEDGHFALEIEAPARSPDTLIRVEQAEAGYGERILLSKVNMVLRAGARIALLGPNGAGKSTLIKKILYPALGRLSGSVSETPGKYDRLEGDVTKISQVEFVDQNPIGKSSRSNPISYVKAYDAIRTLYSEQPIGKQRGYKPSHFSFNVEGGRCDTCEGEGEIKVEMQFMADIYLKCESCHGKRFKQEVLEVEHKGKNIFDVLDMTVEEGLEFFRDKKPVYEKILPLFEVGLGYVKLGQSSNSLSGGEAQRVKLASFLGKNNSDNQNNIMFIFDEPTTGLHFHDISKLLKAINALVDQGHTVIVIEHNLEVIKCADWIIDLGPEGGEKKGGHLLFEGTPEEMAKKGKGYTAEYLRLKLTSTKKSPV